MEKPQSKIITKSFYEQLLKNPKIDHREDIRKYILPSEPGCYIGVDNTTNEAFTEEFQRLDSCIRWIEGEVVEFAKIRRKKINLPFLDSAEECNAYLVEHEADLFTIENYFYEEKNCKIKINFITTFPDWVIIEEDYDNGLHIKVLNSLNCLINDMEEMKSFLNTK